MGTFANRTILLTGASEGIGRALALQLAAERARLALVARNAERLEQVAADCRARGAEVFALNADVSRQEDCQALVARTVERFGGLDVLVSNAGISMWSRFEQVQDFATFERLMAVNYLGCVYLTAAALPHLKRSRGLIVGVASIAGLTGVPERTGYAASKHALVGFLESLRIELAEEGVDVTIVAPDLVLTQIHHRAMGPDGKPLGHVPPHGPRVMTAEACAKRIVPAMRRRQRLLVTSFRGRFVRLMRLIAPRTVDRIAARAIRERR